MLKLSLMASGLSFPTIALASGLQQSTDKGSFLLTMLLVMMSMAILTQIGFYVRYLLKQSAND